MEKKQTAVEFFAEKSKLKQDNFDVGLITFLELSKQKMLLLDQCKQTEKEQIIKAVLFGMQKGINYVNKVPETDCDFINNYYNETYGGKDEN